MSLETLKCLSIRQPWADLIMSGNKEVENRTWNWLKDRDWKKEGPVVLGIHASKHVDALTDDEEREFWPGHDEKDIGCVLGIVNLVNICRPRSLPATLRKHRHVNHHPQNWCWVLDNPRRFLEPIDAVGNARIFHVQIPKSYLESSGG